MATHAYAMSPSAYNLYLWETVRSIFLLIAAYCDLQHGADP